MPPSVHVDPDAAELRVIIRADSVEDLFVEAARLVARECGPAEGTPGAWVTIELAARDQATLLVDWINELIGRSEVERRAFDEVRNMEIRPRTLYAEVRGTPVPAFASPLKAATFHGLELAHDGRGWRAEVLIDV